MPKASQTVYMSNRRAIYVFIITSVVKFIRYDMIYLCNFYRVVTLNCFNQFDRPVNLLLNMIFFMFFDVIFLCDVISSIGVKISDVDTFLLYLSLKYNFTSKNNNPYVCARVPGFVSPVCSKANGTNRKLFC